MTLDEEIEWWTNVMHRYSNEIGFVALGMATGLKLAKAEFGAKDNDPVLASHGTEDHLPRRRPACFGPESACRDAMDDEPQ